MVSAQVAHFNMDGDYISVKVRKWVRDLYFIVITFSNLRFFISSLRTSAPLPRTYSSWVGNLSMNPLPTEDLL